MSESDKIKNSSLKPRTSKLAIVSFVLAVLNLPVFFGVFGLPSIPAFICGLVAMFYIIKSKGRLKGLYLATAGVTISAMILYVSPGPKTLWNWKIMGAQSGCESNLNRIGFYISLVYENNYDTDPNYHPHIVNEKLNITAVETWCDTFKKEAPSESELLVCPAAKNQENQCSYAMNKNAVGKNIDELPGDMVVLFEADLGYNGIGGPDDMVFRHPDGCGVLMANGNSKFVKQQEAEKLRWTVDKP